MLTTGLRGLAFICCFAVAAVLLTYDASVYAYAHYLGALMIFGALALLITAVLIVWGNQTRALERFAWGFGGFVMVGVIGGFVASRTVGLIGYHNPTWVWPGIVSIVAGAVYLVAYVGTVLRRGGQLAPYPNSGEPVLTNERLPGRTR